MAAPGNRTKESILQLQHIKQRIIDCNRVKDVVFWIDELMEMLLQLSRADKADIGLNTTSTFTHTHYLRELRSVALSISEEQLPEFCRDLSINLANIQFDLWSGPNKDLIALLEEDNTLN